jgi:hypothetical protein
MNSTLTLNNTARSPVPVTVTIYNMRVDLKCCRQSLWTRIRSNRSN